MDDRDLVRLVAQVQFELLASGLDVLASYIKDARFAGEVAELHDIEGDLVALRYPLTKEGERLGYVDVAIHPALGGPLHAICRGQDWDPVKLLEEARQSVEKLIPGIDSGPARFEIYSYPRLGIRFFGSMREILLDTSNGSVIERRSSLTPGGWGDYESWSVLRRAEGVGGGVAHDYEEWVSFGRRLTTQFPHLSPEEWLGGGLTLDDIIRAFPELRADEGETVKMCRNLGDEDCFQGKGQKTSHWCVPASVKMALDFFLPAAFEPTQEVVAAKLGQGTIFQSSELTRGSEGDIVVTIGNFAKQAGIYLRSQIETEVSGMAQMIVDEISAGKPLVVLGVEHAWAAFGFKLMSGTGAMKQMGLALFDPLPVDTGSFLWWQLFNPAIHTAVIGIDIDTQPRGLPHLSLFKKMLIGGRRAFEFLTGRL